MQDDFHFSQCRHPREIFYWCPLESKFYIIDKPNDTLTIPSLIYPWCESHDIKLRVKNIKLHVFSTACSANKKHPINGLNVKSHLCKWNSTALKLKRDI